MEEEKDPEQQSEAVSDQQASPKATEETTPSDAASKSEGKLNAAWTFWFDNPKIATTGEWKDSLKRLATFDTVEKFWAVYNNIRCPTDVAVASNYSLFREGIEPTWEDPQNTDGGKFVFTISKRDSKSGKTDEWWLFTVLAVVGETLDADGSQVNGCVISIRKNQDRIALWLRSRKKPVCIEVGMRFKKALRLDDKMTLRYQTHSDAAATGHSFRNEVHFEV